MLTSKIECKVWCYKKSLADMGLPEEHQENEWLPMTFDLDKIIAIKSTSESDDSFSGPNKAVIFLGTGEGQSFVTDLDYRELVDKWAYGIG